MAWLVWVGFVLKLCGFAVRDELVLRGLVATGMGCDVAYFLLRSEPVWASAGAQGAIVLINIVLIVTIVNERTRWGLSKPDRALMAHFPTLTPGQFRRMRRLMRIETAPAGTVLATEGMAVPDLVLVLDEPVVIRKAGASFPIPAPTFVGEIALLSGSRSSADVFLPEGGAIVRMDLEALRAAMARRPALGIAMTAIFGSELARKVAYSVPLETALTHRT